MKTVAQLRSVHLVAKAALLISLLFSTTLLARAAPSLFEKTDLFVAGRDGINTYRIPSLICTKKGTLLAFSEGRKFNAKDGTPTDLVLKRSVGNFDKSTALSLSHHTRRSGLKDMIWLPMQTLVHSAHGEAYMNPVPLIDRTNGTIYLLLNYYPAPYADVPAEIWLFTSTNEGATWTGPRDLSPSTGKHELGPGDGIQLKSGTLMAPVYDGDIFSDDHGKTWKASGLAPGLPSETQVVESVDGSLTLSRRGRPNRLMMRSEDAGHSWSAPEPNPELPDPDCQGSLIRYTWIDDGYTKNRLLFSNPVAGLDPASIQASDPRGRLNLTVRLSYDEGKTWPVAKLIQRGPAAYSSMTVIPDGTVVILFEAGNSKDRFNPYRKLTLARFNLEWLSDGKDDLTKSN